MKGTARIAWLIASVLALGLLLSWAYQLHHRNTTGEPVANDQASGGRSTRAATNEASHENVPDLQPPFQSQHGNGPGPVGHTVGGRVIDELTRKPVSGATVSFRYLGSRRSAGASVLTAADGLFTLANLPSERIVVQVSAMDYAPAEHGVTPPISAPVQISLSRGGAIAGQLLAADGATGVPGKIDLWSITTSSGGSTDSKEDGQFQLPNLKPGRYRVSGHTRAGHTSPVEVLLGPNERVDGVVLTVLPGRAIRGTVSGLQPKDLLQVRVSANAVESGDQLDTEVGSSGTFRIENVQPGPVQVIANAPMGRSVGRMIQMTATDDASVDLRFTNGVRLTGRVTRRGQPVADALVSATFNGDIELSATARTSSTGHYAIDGLAAGEEHDVAVNHRTAGKIRIFDGWVFNIELSDTRVSGRVLRMSGEPLPGAYVMIQSAGAGRGVRSDQAGEFSATGIQPGEIDVVAYKPGYTWLRQSFHLQDTSAPLTLRLQESPGVEVRARDAVNGTPLPEVHVFVGVPGKSTRTHFRLELDENGRGSLPAELAGHGLLFAASEYGTIQFDTWNGQPLDLAFEMPQQAAQ